MKSLTSLAHGSLRSRGRAARAGGGLPSVGHPLPVRSNRDSHFVRVSRRSDRGRPEPATAPRPFIPPGYSPAATPLPSRLRCSGLRPCAPHPPEDVPARSLRSLRGRATSELPLASLAGTSHGVVSRPRFTRHARQRAPLAVGARRRGARAAPAPREGRPTERSEGGSRLGRAWLRSWRSRERSERELGSRMPAQRAKRASRTVFRRTERANRGRASLSGLYPKERSD